jgi:uncharacterized C2H2 Zn-finger protein
MHQQLGLRVSTVRIAGQFFESVAKNPNANDASNLMLPARKTSRCRQREVAGSYHLNCLYWGSVCYVCCGPSPFTRQKVTKPSRMYISDLSNSHMGQSRKIGDEFATLNNPRCGIVFHHDASRHIDHAPQHLSSIQRSIHDQLGQRDSKVRDATVLTSPGDHWLQGQGGLLASRW